MTEPKVGDVILVHGTLRNKIDPPRRADITSITERGGPQQKVIYHARFRRGGRPTLLFRNEFVLDPEYTCEVNCS
jgi:hypothetical protein